MQVALYARVSTPNQQQESTIISQIQLLKQHIQQQQWALLPEHEFKDDGVSGARLDRPALDRLRDCAGRGEFDAVIILAPDRSRVSTPINGCSSRSFTNSISRSSFCRILLAIRRRANC